MESTTNRHDAAVSLVRIEQLHYRYPPFDPNDPNPDQRWALEDLSLEVEAGEFLGVLGTTGSGKSTLCLALNGLAPQQTSGTIRGDVWIGELNTKRTPVIDVARRVGLVFQEPESNFLGLTVEDEVAFGLENLAVEIGEIEERVDWALKLTGAETLRSRSVARLSGGQKQRVAIAATVAMLPAVLVLDDPTAELDPAGTAEVLEVVQAVRTRRPETAVIMTSGDPAPIVAGADRMLVLDGGRRVFLGTPSEYIDAAPELLERGVAAPPFIELASRLNQAADTQFRFDDPDDAAQQMRRFFSI